MTEGSDERCATADTPHASPFRGPSAGSVADQRRGNPREGAEHHVRAPIVRLAFKVQFSQHFDLIFFSRDLISI